ncbi:glycosyltransferase family 4 protein [Pseudoalteromonas sp. SW0106-04]|uniref:glycosyltransferase family 4 protein n=1 Tax=Pseudoalteromonas sp. SW0106-04 TaxID=1702169 RepID=UPI0006B5674C|nr:glycosyltransferase family 4 protein [Pseudoalteromonas sp. SW0106-04]
MSPKPSAPLLGQFVDKQVESLNKAGGDVEYFKMRWNGDSLLHKLFRYPVFFFHFLVSIVLLRKKYDIIHVHYYFPTIFLAMAYHWLVSRRSKLVVTCHGSDLYLYDPPNWFYRKFSHYVHLWIFTSKALKERFYRPVDNYKILSAGFDDSVFNLEENSVAFANKTYLACMICHVDKNKGVDRLLSLAKALPGHRFALVGSGPMSDTVKEFASQHKNLEFFGSQSAKQVKVIISQSKCCLSLSRNESFGLTIAEAQACGTPVVATNTDGSNEQLAMSGRLVEQSSEGLYEKLPSKLLSISTMPESEYDELCLLVHQQAQRFSLTNVVTELMATYKQLIEGGCAYEL